MRSPIKTIVYSTLVIASGVALLYAIPPSTDDHLKNLHPEARNERDRKLQQFLDVMKGAATDSKPLYRQSPKELRESHQRYIDEASKSK